MLTFYRSDWDRFLDKIEFTESCWLWTGAKSNSYGAFWFEGKNHKAHRIAYRLWNGCIPFLYEIDHVKEKCPNKLCVNPDHLEAVTGQENMYRKNGSTSSHCKNGHSRTKHGSVNNRGTFVCLLCASEAAKRYRDKL